MRPWLVTAALLLVPLSPSPPSAAATRGFTFGEGPGYWAGTAVDLLREADGSLTPVAPEAEYVSPRQPVPFPFNAVSLSWSAEIPAGAEIFLEVRTSQNGVVWSDWYPIERPDNFLEAIDPSNCLFDPGEDPAGSPGLSHFLQPYSELRFVGGSWVQYRARLLGSEDGAMPRLRQVRVNVVASGTGAARTLALDRVPRPVELAAPAIVSRAAWGANESYRFDANGNEVWPPDRRPVVKAVLHHTVTSDGGDDPAAVVRGIYYYHAVQLGWGDIGYNFLVDQRGNIYEGRFGGARAMGGHALRYNPGSIGIAAIGNFSAGGPNAAMQDALARLLTWQAALHGIHPAGSGFFIDKDLPNILGHRDALETSCPGDALSAAVPGLRSAAWDRLPNYATAWISHDTPASLGLGETRTVNLTLRNGGKRLWQATGRPLFRLGYHWYREDGSQYAQPPEDDRRASLPRDVGTGESVSLAAATTAPREAGIYTLKWDMVHEGTTWFADAGADPLPVRIIVGLRPYAATWLSHDTPATMLGGRTYTVNLRLRNDGAQTWTAGGSRPFRLGYHWYDSQGNQYVQPPEDDLRTTLPGDVARGGEVTLQARVTAPRTSGDFTLSWDMVHELVTWFAQTGSAPLNLSVRASTSPDLGLRWESPGAIVEPGNEARLVLVYGNKGAEATGVRVTVTLPAEAAFLGSVPAMSAVDARTLRYEAGTVGPGASGRLEIRLRLQSGLAAGSSFPVNASIADDGSRGTDASPADNQAGARLAVPATRTYFPVILKGAQGGW